MWTESARAHSFRTKTLLLSSAVSSRRRRLRRQVHLIDTLRPFYDHKRMADFTNHIDTFTFSTQCAGDRVEWHDEFSVSGHTDRILPFANKFQVVQVAN